MMVEYFTEDEPIAQTCEKQGHGPFLGKKCPKCQAEDLDFELTHN